MGIIIFLVEDEKLFADNIKLMIEYYEGYKVYHFTSGLDALAAAKTIEPNLVISDVKMPLVNGFEFCELFRNAGFHHVPFLFLTCSANFDDMRKGMNLGADDYLVKPVKIIDLIKAIKIRLKRSVKIQEKYLIVKDTNTRVFR